MKKPPPGETGALETECLIQPPSITTFLLFILGALFCDDDIVVRSLRERRPYPYD
jgi:hypothetical protein